MFWKCWTTSMQVLRKFFRGIDKRLKSRDFDSRIFGGSNPPTPAQLSVLESILGTKTAFIPVR